MSIALELLIEMTPRRCSLAPFEFGGELTLNVLPFDLDKEVLIGAETLGLDWRSERHMNLVVAP
jgi:hypothetical protein